MNSPSAPTETTMNAQPRREVDTHLRGRWLMLARVAWIVIALLALGLFIASIPTYFAFLHVVCTSALATCRNNGQLTPDDLRALQATGLSLDFYATYWVAIYIVFVVVYAASGTVIFWRKSDDRMALFASLALVVYSVGFNSKLVTLPSAWSLPSQFVVFLGSSSIFLLFYLFPSGRFIPRWTRWLSVGGLYYGHCMRFSLLSTPPSSFL